MLSPPLRHSTPSPLAVTMDSLDHCLLDSVFDFFDDTTDVSLPSSITCPDDDEEEELEWLNGDAFPTLDTFDALACATAPKQQSPVSVLESYGLLRVPGKARSKRRRRCYGRAFFPVVGFASPATATAAAAAAKRRCLHCEAEKTPQWRAGPLGPKTLCNACGVRFKSGRLVPEYRPANSPTYSSALHSNSHRKIVEMRRLKYSSGQG